MACIENILVFWIYYVLVCYKTDINNTSRLHKVSRGDDDRKKWKKWLTVSRGDDDRNKWKAFKIVAKPEEKQQNSKVQAELIYLNNKHIKYLWIYLH